MPVRLASDMDDDMPTVKKSLAMRETFPAGMPDYLLSGIAPDGAEALLFLGDSAACRRTWRDLRDELLPDWIREHPGTRPWAWWEFDAPRWDRKFGAFYDGTLPEPRLRIGGKGTPAFEALAYVPSFTRGIPDIWVSAFDVAYYNGRAKDIHGDRIGTEYKEGHFPHEGIDPAGPPVFESEAAYLKRHGLFLPGEEKRLTDADFRPEVIS